MTCGTGVRYQKLQNKSLVGFCILTKRVLKESHCVTETSIRKILLSANIARVIILLNDCLCSSPKSSRRCARAPVIGVIDIFLQGFLRNNMIASGVSLVQKIIRLRSKQNYDQDPIHATEAKQETKQSKLLRVGKNSDEEIWSTGWTTAIVTMDPIYRTLKYRPMAIPLMIIAVHSFKRLCDVKHDLYDVCD